MAMANGNMEYANINIPHPPAIPKATMTKQRNVGKRKEAPPPIQRDSTAGAHCRRRTAIATLRTSWCVRGGGERQRDQAAQRLNVS